MGESGIGENAQGNEVLQAFERPHPRLSQTEDLLEILIEDFDAPAAEIDCAPWPLPSHRESFGCRWLRGRMTG